MLTQLKDKIGKFRSAIKGATAIEYALIASLIALGIMGGAQALSKRNQDNYQCLNNVLGESFVDDGRGPCAPFEKTPRPER